MANTKISALTAGAPAVSTDLLPIDRSGANYSLQVSDVGANILTNPNVKNTITTGINALGNVTGATNVDLSKGNVVTMTLTGATTLSLSNAVASAGQEVTFIITQDGTGGRVITWPTTVPATIAPYASIAAASVSVFKALVDGSGALNFVGNGPVVVFRNLVASITSSVTTESIWTPTAPGQYKVSLALWCSTTGTTATMAFRLKTTNGNQALGAASPAVACTTLALQQGQQFRVTVLPSTTLAFASQVVGYDTTLTNAIGTAVYSAELIVEYLGN